MATTFAVTGKGGTGKTTIAALTVKYLKEHASGSILALDADPDANLATVLGIPVDKTIGDVREETLREMKNFPPGMSKEAYIQAGLHQIIEETPKVDLITMGRSEGPGCYCYINSILRKFAEDLATAYQYMVFDNEAGLEHLSRRIASRIDNLLVVVSETPLSIDCARRISEIVPEMKNQVINKYILTNQVRPERLEAVKAKTAGLGMEYLGNIPYDEALETCIFEGRSVYELDGTPAVLQMEEAMKKIGVE